MTAMVVRIAVAAVALMTDPVSGNEIPIGSSAENVRDDIEIMISEGEYVLPADVVKWHGLKHIMDMEAEAKMGLMSMYADGLIQYVDEEGSVEEEVEEAEEVTETPEGNEVEVASVEVTEEEPEVNETEEYQESEYGTKTSLYGMMKKEGSVHLKPHWATRIRPPRKNHGKI